MSLLNSTKMSLKNFLILTILLPSTCGTIIKCLQRNVSCVDIQTQDGFNFSHEAPEGSEITVIAKQTPLAHAKLDIQNFSFGEKVMKMDNYSVFTRQCEDLEIRLIVPEPDRIKETCVKYAITETITIPDPSVESDPSYPGDPGNSTASWVAVGVIVGLVIIGIVGLFYCYWKKKGQRTSGNLVTCTRFDRGISEAERGEAGGSWLSGSPSIADTRESDTVGEELAHSIDPEAECRTPQSLCLDRISSRENGNLSAPDVNTASDRAMHRNLREDPGGVNDNQFIVGDRDGEWTRGGHGPEVDGSEGQWLLSSQRAAAQDSDMTGEAVALVNEHGFDPDQVSRCSTAPGIDVESAPNML